MCTSVPQIVVVVTRSSASSGPGAGIGFSSRTMRPGSTKIAAFIFGMSLSPASDRREYSPRRRRRRLIQVKTGRVARHGWTFAAKPLHERP
jgi:hypothetical protein